MVSSPMVLCNVLEVGMVGKDLRDMRFNISMKFMCKVKWESRSWLLIESCNIVTSAEEIGTITNRS